MTQPWLVILSVGFLVSAAGILVAIAFIIRAVNDIRRLTVTLDQFIRNTEERINPVLTETEQALRSVRKISDDVGTVTGNVRGLSDILYDAGTNLKALNAMIGAFREGISLRATGIQAGIKTAMNVLINQIRERR